MTPVIRYLSGHDTRVEEWNGTPFGVVTRLREGRTPFGRILRVRVKGIDGQNYYGSGPVDGGTYVRLRPMKGAGR